jgi:hypothetical protein
MDAIVDGKRAEFVDAFGQRSNVAHEILEQSLGHDRLGLQQLAEFLGGHRSDEAARPRFHAGRARSAVDGGIFAEDVAGSQSAKAHRLACDRVDGDGNLAARHEEHVI